MVVDEVSTLRGHIDGTICKVLHTSAELVVSNDGKAGCKLRDPCRLAEAFSAEHSVANVLLRWQRMRDACATTVAACIIARVLGLGKCAAASPARRCGPMNTSHVFPSVGHRHEVR